MREKALHRPTRCLRGTGTPPTCGDRQSSVGSSDKEPSSRRGRVGFVHVSGLDLRARGAWPASRSGAMLLSQLG